MRCPCRYVERTYTHKKYDDKQVNQQIKLLGMQMIVTAAIHIMARMSTPLLLACTQPIFQMFEPVFRARVLGQKIEVKRPTPDPILECAPLPHWLDCAQPRARACQYRHCQMASVPCFRAV